MWLMVFVSPGLSFSSHYRHPDVSKIPNDQMLTLKRMAYLRGIKTLYSHGAVQGEPDRCVYTDLGHVASSFSVYCV